ncbi:DEAD/DEAH box helicase [Arabiibacter massiliensis]|uniref:DEAD/DEAH box helicase n=1 Tax=Arabiibacter massiliensis TaxID=1870985 RepID=UPI0009B98D77|nr:DEAD/DEAH box helicase [Arabiibacter massiliensis]
MDEANDITPLGALGRFSDAVRGWFLDAFEGPTPVQERAWEAIAEGENALVIAPTGSGKTLAAFLFALDALMREKAAALVAKPAKGARVLYVSPLKALGADVERNLQAPLAGIAARLAASGEGMPEVRTGMRTGDTTPDARRALVRNPPDILITTPESLYLMLTSKARETLRRVETVIVDEVHALAGTKRGAHLALSLERLDELLERPAQRVGLSATVRPAEEVARFLGGPHPVRVVAAEGAPNLDVRVAVPVQDMTAVPAFGGFEPDGARGGRRGGGGGGPRRAPVEEAWKSDRALRRAMDGRTPKGGSPDSRMGSSSIWPYVESALLDEVLAHRTTIVFVNSRGLCEKLTARLNELYAKRRGLLPPSPDDGGAPVGMRSDMGGTGELVQAAPEIIAKAHHGSVSKERRAQVERELKAGELPCVVATSSLELGIDMGSIDLVLQVAPPPSVASGLQRVGRANHRVGGRPAGVIFPRTRTEVVDAAVAAEGMAAGAIERTRMVENPLDVLSQQTVAAVVMDELAADDWYAVVRRAAPFANLPRSAFDAVLGMLAGAYASADLADFSPRIVWDRERGMLIPRPGSQRQAVTAAGTIPDRGMFSVVLPEGEAAKGRRRVGELDEEMVYESRVGDIIALGTSTWRIREITRDRVVVDPAPGRSARLPFWHGEGVGRPAEAGKARGAFVRAVAAGIGGGEEDGAAVDPALEERLAADGLDENARRNLVELVRAQRAVTGVVPDERTLLVERCEDEQGDWRVILHSPYGRRVHEPWAMAVAERLARTRGFDPQAMAGDDGILVRIPMTEARLPGAELFAFDPDELERIVRGGVGTTALFAARFRECAARALLMSPTTPGKRAPLWQQRLRAGQLLEAARREGDFPLLAECARECLQDVYDLPALREVMEGLRAGTVRLAEAQTSTPSPFAAPLLFGYVGEHLYDGDLPHAERRASLLSLDPGLLGELLGSPDMGELLDADVVRTVEEELQRLAPERRARGVEGAADLLRALGPLSEEEVAARLRNGEARALLEELERAHRAFPVTLGATLRWAAADDARRIADALGANVPDWALALCHPERSAQAPLCHPERAKRVEGAPAPPAGDPPTSHPLDDLLRFARTHGPFAAEDAASHLGIGPAVARDGLERLAAEGRIVRARFGDGREWAADEVLKRLRARSLAKARQAVRPVPRAAYVRYLFDVQGVGADGARRLEGVDGTAQVLSQFEGVALPAALWESSVLPARVRDYRPAFLDELLASGEVVWAGERRADEGGEGRLVAFYPTDSPLAPVQPVVPEPDDGSPSVERAVIEALGHGGGLFFRQIVDAVRRRRAPEPVDEGLVAPALKELAWSGRATNDTFAPVRAAAASRVPAPAKRRVSSRRARMRGDYSQALAGAGASSAQAAVQAVQAGRWSLIAPAPANDTVRAVALVESLLDRYGVLTRDAAVLSGVPGGLGTLMDVLRQMEDAGEVLRGMFVEGLGPAQFAARETVDALRAYAADDDPAGCVVLAADDPASLFGAGIPWPPLAGASAEDAPRPTRRPGALVVVRGGEPVLYATANLRSMLAFTDDEAVLAEAVHALAEHVRCAVKREGAEGARKKIVVEDFNGRPVLDTPFAAALASEGFVRLPDGMRLYASPF